MSIHLAQRPDGWRALVERERERERDTWQTAVRGALAHASRSSEGQSPELARWENEGGPADAPPKRTPVNQLVRELVRQCLIPRVATSA